MSDDTKRPPRDGSEPNNGKQIASDWAHFGVAPGEKPRVRNPKNRRKVLGSAGDMCIGLDFDPWTGK